MSDIGHEQDCSCGNCQPQAVKIRQLERDLAAANTRNAELVCYRKYEQNKRMEAQAQIAELESELKSAVGRNIALQAEVAKWGNLTPDDYKNRIAELERDLAATKEANERLISINVKHGNCPSPVECRDGVDEDIQNCIECWRDFANTPQPPKEGE